MSKRNAALMVAAVCAIAHGLAGTSVDLRGTPGNGPAVVHGAGAETAAARVAAALEKAVGARVETIAAKQVMEPGTWRLAAPWLRRPLILLGSVTDNEVVFALHSRYLAGTNAAYPGAGRYVLRTLSAPFRREIDMLAIGAADPAGLAAGVARFEALIAGSRGCLAPQIEGGDAKGPVRLKAGGGTDFARLADTHYWTGDPKAAVQGRDLLLKELATRERGLWGFQVAGHYDWERLYRPLRQFQVAGALSAEETREVDLRLAQNVLENTDWALVACLNTKPGELPRKASRHQLSALAGGFLVFDYLEHVGTVPEEMRAAVHDGYGRLLAHIESYVAGGVFCSPITGTEGAETLNIMADMYLYHGDRRVVTDGTLRRMADLYLSAKDNLGCHACDDSYIGCRPGSHFARSSGGATWLWAGYLYGDGGYRWLLENVHCFLTHFQVSRPPEPLGLLAGVPPVEPQRDLGVSVQPLDRVWYHGCTTYPAGENAVPVELPYERTFTRAAFRDGFAATDAYLLFQGVDRGSIHPNYAYQANAITRYTELGSLLLFSNSLRHTGWAQNVVSVSRGAADPQSTACDLVASINTPFVAALRSTHERHGGMRWTRSVIRRRRGYTVILDQLTAHDADTYGMTCRWRSYHMGRMREASGFEAVDGHRQVRFRIMSATPVTWQVETEKCDGAARPTMVRQSRRENLTAGESVTFQNLLYASDPEHPRSPVIKRLGENAVLVHGRIDDGVELAAIGTGALDLPGCSVAADLWYVSRTGLALAAVRRAAFGDELALTAEQPFDVMLDGADGRGWIEVPGATDISLRASGGILVDGLAASGTLDLAPGRHPFTLASYGGLLARIETELSTHARRGGPVQSVPAPAVALAGGASFLPLWEHQGEPPPLSEHGSIRVWGEPEPNIGRAETWTNRLIGPPPGYGWHGSERAGWTAGTQGAILMDLGEPVDIADIELVRSRRCRTEAGAFNPGEFAFDVVLSNDNFQKDLRKLTVTDVQYGVLRVENAHYTHTRRFPKLTVPIGQRARYVRLVPRRVKEIKSPPADYYGTYRDDEISFMELTVHRMDRESRRRGRFVSSARGGLLLIEAGTRLTALDAGGTVRWEQQLDSPAAAPSRMVDVDGDGRPEALVFTLAETLAIFDVETGERKLLFDLDAQPNTPNVAELTHSSLRPNAFAAWRPDANGTLEIAFFPHYDYGRILLCSEPRYQKITYANTMRSAKFAFEVPDVTGDGRSELALVGIYGRQFGVVPSEAPLDAGEFGKYLMAAPLNGYDSGNMELQLYWDGAVVRDGAGKWLGTVAINPGGLDYYTHPGFLSAWSHFHHPENRCFALADLDGDGTPEILVGRVDGCVVAYSASDGKVVARAMLDGELRSLVAYGNGCLAGTAHGLFLLGPDLQPRACHPGAVEDLVVLSEPEATAAALLSDGRLVALRVAPVPRR